MPARFNYPSLPGNPDSTQPKSALDHGTAAAGFDVGVPNLVHAMVGPKLFSPQSVAVVGASLRQSSAGHAVLRNLLKVGNACPPISASGIDADRLLPRRQTV
jgi:hypothetical protein